MCIFKFLVLVCLCFHCSEKPETGTSMYLTTANQRGSITSLCLLAIFFPVQTKGHIFYKSTFLAHLHSIQKDKQDLFCKDAVQLVGLRPVLVHGVVLP